MHENCIQRAGADEQMPSNTSPGVQQEHNETLDFWVEYRVIRNMSAPVFGCSVWRVAEGHVFGQWAVAEGDQFVFARDLSPSEDLIDGVRHLASLSSPPARCNGFALILLALTGAWAAFFRSRLNAIDAGLMDNRKIP